ncbi:hypothetical protein IQ254_16570 [Nodosilinea sp. LEGE 07088]|uniref:hypothetical protein n=1 Tax=Nodosilinea sp. LEGE 07088 TaxID=2777968 RepID=UPI001880962D|nr:hypothetical protein [Nodosilinea sp. LEGE 07088]MBE9138788.1 hypothetical protein [Nodosilinea sp. LEGE 07088]
MGPLVRRFRVLMMGAIALGISLMLAQGMSLDRPHSAAVAQGNPSPPLLAASLPMVTGNFEDPQGRFQIGIFDGYSVSSAGGSPVFQAADGSLAYTVAVTPAPPAESPEAALVVAAEDTFGAGEGYVASDVQPIPGGGVRINWSGRLSQGAAPPQAISGKIFARQRDAEVFLLLVAATDSAEAQLSDAIIALGGTLIVP